MAGFSQLAGLPELVRDSQLPATFRWEGQQQFTIHTQGASRRAKQSQEVWANMGTLGQGGFGSVELQAKQTKSKRPGEAKELRAVKSIRISEEELKDNLEFYVRELEAILKFSQARYGELFVKSYGWFACQSVLYIAMEYCELGDLQKYLLKKCPDRRLPENQAHDIASQVLDALARMHEEKFAHRDLKPANILIKSHPPAHPWVVKVADFGISRRGQSTAMNATTSVRGTGSFMPPELLGFSGENSRAADLYAVDMWCYGETLFRVLAGDGTFKKPADLYGYYFGQVKFPSSVLEDIQLSPEAIDFLRSLLACDPAQRLTAEMAFDHPWMQTDFHGSDASSRRSSRRMSSPTPLESDVTPMLESTVTRLAQTDDTEASASWPESLSQMNIEHESTLRASAAQQNTVNPSNIDSRESFPRDSGSVQATLVNTPVGKATSSQPFDRPLEDPTLPSSATSMPGYTNSASHLQSSVSPKYGQGGMMSYQDGPVEEDTAASLSWEEDTAASLSWPTMPTVQPSQNVLPVAYTEGSSSQVSPPTLAGTTRASRNRQNQIPPLNDNNHSFGHHATEETESALVPGRLDSETRSKTKRTNPFGQDLPPGAQDSTNSPGREPLQVPANLPKYHSLAGMFSSKEGEDTGPQYSSDNIPVHVSETTLAHQKAKAETSFKNGGFLSAKYQYQRYWMNAKSTLGEKDTRTMHALQRLVQTLIVLEEYTTAEELCRESVALKVSTIGPDHMETLKDQNRLATCMAHNGYFDGAISSFQDTIRSCRRNGYTTVLYESLEGLAYVYFYKGNLEEAESTFQSHIKAKGNVLGHTHDLIFESVYQFAIQLESVYGLSGATSRLAQQFFRLANELERSGEPLTNKTRHLLDEMRRLEKLRLMTTASQGTDKSKNRHTRPKPSSQYPKGSGSQGDGQGMAKNQEKERTMSKLRRLLSDGKFSAPSGNSFKSTAGA